VPVQGAVAGDDPAEVALIDVRRALRMFETVAVPVLGVVENMSYFIAPDTGNRYNIFVRAAEKSWRSSTAYVPGLDSNGH